MRQFAVIGLGSFGSTVATELSKKGLPVLAIDKNGTRVDDMREHVAHAIVGDASDTAFLGSIGISEVDVALVALGDDIEASVLVTLNLSEIEIPKIIVKGISPEHGSILCAVGAHQVLYPEKEMAQKLARYLASPNIIDHIPLVEGYNIIEIVAPDIFANKTIIDLNLRREYGVELLAIKRSDPKTTPSVVVVPGAGEIIYPEDKLVVLGAVDKVEQLQEL
ncbi:TrkA family potassium uptake protein [bacterium]|nr:TrkA family potassium uptake protein [bacterium]